MRRPMRMALATVAAATPLTALGVAPAAAEQGHAEREYVGTFQGETIRCSVLGTSSVDLEGPGADESGNQVDFATIMTDDDPRCLEALSWVWVQGAYWRRGATEPDYASTSDEGTHTYVHLVVYPGVDDVDVDHAVGFRCDTSALGCELAFETDPYPFSSK